MLLLKIIIFLLMLLQTAVPVFCQEEPKESANSETEEQYAPAAAVPLPVYVAGLPNINDYNIFANSGWDGNWYIGYNVCWIKKLPPVPNGTLGNYSKAYIGAKIGRAKTRRKLNKPIWEKEPIPGDIYVAIASTPAWRSSTRYYLASTQDIPLESDSDNALEGVSESRWFWTEIPLSQVSMDGLNYLAIWSPTEYFVNSATSPILCGGWGAKGNETSAWINDEIKGTPPIEPEKSIKTGITVFEPALVLKLIPADTIRELQISITDIKEGKKGTQNKTVFVFITSNEIERTYLQVSIDNKTWKKVGRITYSPPWIFTIDPDQLPGGKIFIRAICEDIWMNQGTSVPIELLVQK